MRPKLMLARAVPVAEAAPEVQLVLLEPRVDAVGPQALVPLVDAVVPQVLEPVEPREVQPVPEGQAELLLPVARAVAVALRFVPKFPSAR